MPTQSLDIVHELKVELEWEAPYASAAYDEYLRWLHLRAKASDFQFCRLPPSRVVALVWNLHRQWTFDYQKTCHYLGKFIHHFPPAMRINATRELAYATTIHMYKSEFKQNPPSPYWDPPICQYKHLLDQSNFSSPPLLDPPHLLDSPRSSLDKPFSRIPPQIKSKRKSVTSSHRKSADLKHRTKQECLILKPIPPGEKRKRGRPSRSQYVSISPIPDSSSSPTASKKHSPQASFSAIANPAAKKLSTATSPPKDTETVAILASSIPLQPNLTDAPPHAIPPRRPRGRPRKDGSWPIPRKRQKAFAGFNQSPRNPSSNSDIQVVEDEVVAQGCENIENEYEPPSGTSIFANDRSKRVVVDVTNTPKFIPQSGPSLQIEKQTDVPENDLPVPKSHVVADKERSNIEPLQNVIEKSN